MSRKIALHRVLTVAGSLLLGVFAGACSVPDGEVVSEGEYLVFEPMGRGQDGQVADTLERVFRDAATWEAFRDSLVAFEAFPDVDFSQQMVVVMALPQDTGGYGVETVAVELRPDEAIVEYVVTQPAIDCIPVPGRSLPYEVVAVRTTELPVRFQRAVEPYRCTFRQ